jgi:single-stranded-DNA-specific exonuclease
MHAAQLSVESSGFPLYGGGVTPADFVVARARASFRTARRWVVPDPTPRALRDVIPALAAARALDTECAPWSDPTVFPGAAAAAQRILYAVSNGERIGIFGDYDCDGITATALLTRFLRRRGVEPIIRLPHRERDGYGFKPQIVSEMFAAGVTLLITVDTGIRNVDAVDTAHSLGIDVIILDHHRLPDGPIPSAHAIVHPLLVDNLPEPHPCAAGVVWCLLHALEDGPWDGRDEDMALATIGTVADLVELRGGNRALVAQGLSALSSLSAGPLSLLRVAACGDEQRSLRAEDIAFRIAPRINAAGRMDDPILALRAILDVGPHLRELEILNARRQLETRTIVDAAVEVVTAMPSLPSFLTLADPAYAPGIVGLVAGKLTEQFGRPSLVASVRGDVCTASLRSTPVYDVSAGLERVKHLLTTFGGHRQAAGCTFPIVHLAELRSSLNEDVASRVAPDDLIPRTNVDAVLDPFSITVEGCNALASLEPFGQGNPEPRFLLQDIPLTGVRAVGADARHLQCRIGPHRAIGFGLGDVAGNPPARCDVLCRIGMNEWNGQRSPQVLIEDLRASGTLSA